MSRETKLTIHELLDFTTDHCVEDFEVNDLLAERVRAVLLRHKPSGEARPVNQDVCRECSWAWPCPTIRALDGER